jgi:hypothetical protein
MDHHGIPAKTPGGVTIERKFALTSPGATFLILSGFVFFASHNTGNNTLYLIAAGSLALFFVDSFMARRNIMALGFEPVPPEGSFAGSPLPVSWKIHEQLGRRRYRLATEHEFLDHLGRNQVLCLKEIYPSFSRGCFPLPPLTITSLFPLGLTRSVLTVTGSRSMSVYPTPRRADLDGSAEGAAAWRENTQAETGDYWMHRPYQAGEDAKYIHWKVSARSDREYIVVNSVAQQAALRLHFDLAACPGDQFEEFLQKITGFLLQSFRERSPSWCWLPGPVATGHWVSLNDQTGLILLLEFLAAISPEAASRLTSPPQDLSVQIVRPADFGPADLAPGER